MVDEDWLVLVEAPWLVEFALVEARLMLPLATVDDTVCVPLVPLLEREDGWATR
jgi:hypothetical protein